MKFQDDNSEISGALPGIVHQDVCDILVATESPMEIICGSCLGDVFVTSLI